MYLHGLEALGDQRTRVAVSTDGSISATPETHGPSYFRCFRHDGWWRLAMPGRFFHPGMAAPGSRRVSHCSGPTCATAWCGSSREPPAPNSSVWTGSATPQRILRSRVSIAGPWERWCEIGEPVEVLRPEHAHEGAEPCVPSIRGAVDEPVNQLRDPCLFRIPDDRTVAVLPVAGESGIAVARL